MTLQDALFFFLFFMIVLTIGFPTENQNEETETYCEMVLVHRQTGGEFGWPDYKETFDTECQA